MVTGAVEAVRAVRQAIYDGADLIKVIVGLGPELFSLEGLKAIVEEAHKSGRRVAAQRLTTRRRASRLTRELTSSNTHMEFQMRS